MIKEKYLAFLENMGQIELTWWAKTQFEARAKAKEWFDFGKKNGETGEITYGVAQIVEIVVDDDSRSGKK